ncbi:hypothetical protein [Yersinia intermedia]|nr:hypothetical protein [Yersinia intermedia]
MRTGTAAKNTATAMEQCCGGRYCDIPAFGFTVVDVAFEPKSL